MSAGYRTGRAVIIVRGLPGTTRGSTVVAGQPRGGAAALGTAAAMPGWGRY